MDPNGEPKLAGTIFFGTIEAYKEIVGAEVLQRVIESLPNGVQEEIRAVLPISHVRPNLLAEVSEAVGKAVGRDFVDLHVEGIRTGMKYTLKKIWQPLLRVTTDEAMLKRAPLFYSRAYEGGAFAATLLGPGRAEVVLTGWLNAPAIHMRGLGAGIEAVLTFAGRKNVKIECELKPDGAVFQLTWQV